MHGQDDKAFTRPIAAMTLSECVSELETLDRTAQSPQTEYFEEAERDRDAEIERRRAFLYEEVKFRPAETQEDALAKFRWVLYEARHQSRLTGANANDLVGLMKQVAAFPSNSDREAGDVAASSRG